MRFILVIDDNGPEYVGPEPREVIVEVIEALNAVLMRLRDGDRSRVVFAADNRPIGGFQLTLGETEGQPGWERTR